MRAVYKMTHRESQASRKLVHSDKPGGIRSAECVSDYVNENAHLYIAL